MFYTFTMQQLIRPGCIRCIQLNSLSFSSGREELAFKGELPHLPQSAAASPVLVRLIPRPSDANAREALERRLVAESYASSLSKHMLPFALSNVALRKVNAQLNRLTTDDASTGAMEAAADRALAASAAEGGSSSSAGNTSGEDVMYQVVMQPPVDTLAGWVQWCRRQEAGVISARYKMQVGPHGMHRCTHCLPEAAQI